MADTTIRQIIEAALKDARITSAVSPATSDEINDGLRCFEYLITSKEMGQWAQTGTFEIADTFPLPEEMRLYFTAMLAVYLCDQFGKDVPAFVGNMASEGRNQIVGNLMRRPSYAIDAGLLNMPSQMFSRGN